MNTGWTPPAPGAGASPVIGAGAGDQHAPLARLSPVRVSGYRRGSGPGRRLGLTALRHRRALTVVLVLAAVWATVRAAAPPTPATVPVLLAARDLAAGATLRPGDLRPGAWPRALVPAAAIPQASGRVLAAPLGAGEVVTAPRLMGPGLLTGQPPGTVAITVRPADAADLAPVTTGDRVDVLAGPAGDGPGAAPNPWAGAQAVATAALVLAVLHPGTADGGATAGPLGSGPVGGGPVGGGTVTGTDQGGALLLGVDPTTAARLAAARTIRPLSLVVRPMNGT